MAVVQMTSRDEVAANLERASALVRRAVARGAALVALPENVAYMGPEAGKAAAAGRYEPGTGGTGPVADAARALARETGAWVLWGGVPEARDEGDGRVFNAAVAYSPDGVVAARYRKIHLFDIALPDGTAHQESRTMAPGDGVVAVDTPAGRLGLSICYDVRFPELYRRLVDEGATLLAVPAAFTVTTGRDHWHVLLRARAIEAQCYVLAAAQWGAHGHGRTTYGHALIADPWGTVLAECADGEGIALAEVDPERVASVRRGLPSLDHRRLR